ncbi:MAG: hypothetical protein JO210_08125 [Acidobacteriaceae bacterium]|nr:hypothetical protein [Acidobacteriaceae bacterium]
MDSRDRAASWFGYGGAWHPAPVEQFPGTWLNFEYHQFSDALVNQPESKKSEYLSSYRD